MKITIISDIKGEAESIIPYGLNLAKEMDVEVDVVHIIDTRMQQGVTTMYSDSQSVTPGNKFSHEEIIEREKKQVEIELTQVLSRETSQLNYPLKVNTLIELNSLVNKITEDLNTGVSSFLLMNQEADGYILESKKEIAEACKSFNGISLIVPPGYEFHKISSVMLPTDFNQDELHSYRNIAGFINVFYPVVNAVGKSGSKQQAEIEQWKKELTGIFEKSSVNYKVLDSSRFDKDFVEYEEMIEPDLIVLFERPKGWIENIFKKELFERLLEQSNHPILFYSMKQ